MMIIYPKALVNFRAKVLSTISHALSSLRLFPYMLSVQILPPCFLFP